jgi:hypothetical protein
MIFIFCVLAALRDKNVFKLSFCLVELLIF